MKLLSLVYPLLALASESARGHPLYVGSFKEVGPREVDSDVKTVRYADDRLTQWTKGCPADAFVLIKDWTPFQLNGFKKLQRLAEYSLTTGSLLTESMVDLHEFALDLQEYCDGNLYEVFPDTDPYKLPTPLDTTTRIFYIEIGKEATPEIKDELLGEILKRIASPFVTLVYTSVYPQSNPVLRSVRTNPQRYEWEKNHLKHNRDHIAPIIAPLLTPRTAKTGFEAPEARFDLPDNFFKTLLLGSVVTVAFMAYYDYRRTEAAKKRNLKNPDSKTE